jgi:hypothetical protein
MRQSRGLHSPLALGSGLIELGKGGTHGRGDRRLMRFWYLREHVAHKVQPAALPARAGKHAGNGLLERLVGVGDDRCTPPKPPPPGCAGTPSKSSPTRPAPRRDPAPRASAMLISVIVGSLVVVDWVIPATLTKTHGGLSLPPDLHHFRGHYRDNRYAESPHKAKPARSLPGSA